MDGLTVDTKPGLNIAMLDMLKESQAEDPAKYGGVCLMLDTLDIKNMSSTTPITKSVDMGQMLPLKLFSYGGGTTKAVVRPQ